MLFIVINIFVDNFFRQRGTPALHLNEPIRIIDGFNELLVDILSHLFYTSQALKKSKTKILFWYKQTNNEKIQ